MNNHRRNIVIFLGFIIVLVILLRQNFVSDDYILTSKIIGCYERDGSQIRLSKNLISSGFSSSAFSMDNDNLGTAIRPTSRITIRSGKVLFGEGHPLAIRVHENESGTVIGVWNSDTENEQLFEKVSC